MQLNASIWQPGLKLPADCHLVIRHGEKAILNGHDFANPLTACGREEARQLGGALSGRFSRVLSSPVGRCMDTARELCTGARLDARVQPTQVLGDPGPFVVEPETIMAAAGSHGQLIRMLDRHANGAACPGTISREDGARLVGDLLAGPPTLAVTHDAILAALAGAWGLEARWPRFLEGVAVTIR